MARSFNPDQVQLPAGHWIGGTYVNGDGGMALLRPSDAVRFAECPIADAELVERAVAAAKAALKTSGWSTCRPRQRTEAQHRWANLIEAEAETLGRLESLASARPISQSVSIDVAVTAEQIRFFAELADKEGGDVVPTDGQHLGMIFSEPYGVVGAITPWNVPLSMAGWKLGPALAAGNAVVLKPSEMTPFSTLLLAELSVRAGIPAGIVNIVLGDGLTTGVSLIGHPDIAKVSFTGSTLAGGSILKTIAATFHRSPRSETSKAKRLRRGSLPTQGRARLRESPLGTRGSLRSRRGAERILRFRPTSPPGFEQPSARGRIWWRSALSSPGSSESRCSGGTESAQCSDSGRSCSLTCASARQIGPPKRSEPSRYPE